MSNAFLIWPLLYIFFPQSALAGPRSMVSLPPHVAKVVPRCAQQCLESFVAYNFPRNVCRNQQHLDCLCSRKSVSGLTLGEGALQCAASDCSTQVLRTSELEVYDLCKGISSARPRTYGTLTATRALVTTIASSISRSTKAMATSDSIISQSPTPSSITASFSGLSTSALPTPIATAPSWSSISSSLETHASITSSPTHPLSSPTRIIASPASSSPAPATKPALTKSQIAGVAVAGVASAALAFVVLFCIFCSRRRRSSKRFSGSSFGGDRVIETRPGSPALPPVAGQEHEDDHQARNLLVDERQQTDNILLTGDRIRWSLSRRHTRPEDIGVAIAHGTDLQPSPNDIPLSATTQRTTSQLLPDKPTYLLFPPRQPQLRVVNPGISPVSPQSPDSFNASSPVSADIVRTYKPAPAPRGRNASDTSQTSMQLENRTVHESISDPFLDSHKDAYGLIPAGKEQTSTGPTAWTRSLETLRKPVPARHYQGVQACQPVTIRSQPSFQVRDPSLYVGRPTFGESSAQNRLAKHAVRSSVRRTSSNNRPSTVFSTASDTSFEDAGEEDEMPGHPVLSPVAEYPKLSSPPGKITYPKIPGTVAAATYSRRPSPDSPTPHLPPKNPLRGVMAQQRYRSGDVPQPNVAELPGSPVSPVSPLAGRNINSQAPDSPRSAKWQILVGSGQEGIENVRSTPSPRRTGPGRPG